MPSVFNSYRHEIISDVSGGIINLLISSGLLITLSSSTYYMVLVLIIISRLYSSLFKYESR